MGNLYDWQLFIEVMVNRLMVRRWDRVQGQVKSWLSRVIRGRRWVAWLVVLLWRVVLRWWRMWRRSNCWLVGDSRSEACVVLQMVPRVRYLMR